MFEVIFGDLNSAWRQGLKFKCEVEICSMKTSLFLIIINYIAFPERKIKRDCKATRVNIRLCGMSIL